MIIDLKQVSTPELFQLMDRCEQDGMVYRVPEEIIANLDAEGTHVLQAHSLHQPADEDFVRARAMFKLLNQDEGSEIYYVDVRVDTWDDLPCLHLDS
jgi:thioesterase domain-containing protein